MCALPGGRARGAANMPEPILREERGFQTPPAAEMTTAQHHWREVQQGEGIAMHDNDIPHTVLHYKNNSTYTVCGASDITGMGRLDTTRVITTGALRWCEQNKRKKETQSNPPDTHFSLGGHILKMNQSLHALCSSEAPLVSIMCSSVW